ncbi:hypothetical protein T11_3047 [Trichinella zimbabwensis]|uniref:Uncharacterized protein n=1 Tax=Trichinella zimbabwensis TaxID=268475 RepID=A0A0V1GZ23_9BILA|nr:hypothetical protein T11_3047 [Trichinella zimbabwensis]
MKQFSHYCKMDYFQKITVNNKKKHDEAASCKSKMMIEFIDNLTDNRSLSKKIKRYLSICEIVMLTASKWDSNE